MIENLQEIYGIERERDLDRLGSFFLFWGGGGGGDMLWYKPFCLLLVCWSSCTKCTVQYTTLTITYDVIYTTAFFFFCTFSWFVHFFSFISSLFSFIIIFFGGGGGFFLGLFAQLFLACFSWEYEIVYSEKRGNGWTLRRYTFSSYTLRWYCAHSTHMKSAAAGKRSAKHICWRGVPVARTGSDCNHVLTPFGARPRSVSLRKDVSSRPRKGRQTLPPFLVTGASLGHFYGQDEEERKRRSRRNRNAQPRQDEPQLRRSWDTAEMPGHASRGRVFHSCFICFIRLSFVFHSFHLFHSCFIRAICVIPKGVRLGENLRHGRGKEGKERGKERGKSPGSNLATVSPAQRTCNRCVFRRKVGGFKLVQVHVIFPFYFFSLFSFFLPLFFFLYFFMPFCFSWFFLLFFCHFSFFFFFSFQFPFIFLCLFLVLFNILLFFFLEVFLLISFFFRLSCFHFPCVFHFVFLCLSLCFLI